MAKDHRVTLKRRHAYRTTLNRIKTIKTPGNKTHKFIVFFALLRIGAPLVVLGKVLSCRHLAHSYSLFFLIIEILRRYYCYVPSKKILIIRLPFYFNTQTFAGGRHTAQYLSKARKGAICGDCHVALPGVSDCFILFLFYFNIF